MGLRFVKLLKTNVEKMPVFRLSTMLMKINVVIGWGRRIRNSG